MEQDKEQNKEQDKEKERRPRSSFSRRLRSKRTWGSVVLMAVIAVIIWQLTPVSDKEVRRNELVVEVRSWYELRNDSGVVLTVGEIEGDTALTNISTDTLQPAAHVQLSAGYWVNRFRRFPSCHGRIVTKAAPASSQLVDSGSQDLHTVVRRQAERIENELASLQTQQNELHYYRRTHNVQDYGYGAIATYSVGIDHRIDSLRTVAKHLLAIQPGERLSLRRVIRYKLVRSAQGKRIYNKECELWSDEEDGYVVVQLPRHHTPVGIVTHMGIGDGKEAIAQRQAKPSKKKVGKHDDRTIRDSIGTYTGQLDSLKRPSGYGRRWGNQGEYYEGHFEAGLPDGFGFYIAPRQYLQAGEWRKGVFKGEKLTYNKERIYGIDVSRHQHERDGKCYPIDWDRLRITHLGTLSDKRVRGKVDYPVSFAYVKSTEGCTVFNAYYDDDYRDARKAGIRTGTYHFFSLTSGGKAQARHFLEKSHYRKGDLPPVLDVEPTDWQISQAGGAEVMFRQVRAWLQEVQREWKVYPILYISQSFALKHMPLAPDLGDNYFVWIARYGEYMPHFKLTYWQLSPDGRVRGIRGDVDINVYNGYENQYQQFLERHGKK